MPYQSSLLCIILGFVILSSSCTQKEKVKEVDHAELIKQVTSQVNAFYVADTSLNPEGVVDLLWPEFTMLVDGHYIAYDDVKTGSKTFMSSLKTFHTEWGDLRVIPLGNDHAVSSFIFADSLVAKDGTVTLSKGPNTFVWEKRGKIWKVLYADADHYPVQ